LNCSPVTRDLRFLQEYLATGKLFGIVEDLRIEVLPGLNGAKASGMLGVIGACRRSRASPASRAAQPRTWGGKWKRQQPVPYRKPVLDEEGIVLQPDQHLVYSFHLPFVALCSITFDLMYWLR